MGTIISRGTPTDCPKCGKSNQVKDLGGEEFEWTEKCACGGCYYKSKDYTPGYKFSWVGDCCACNVKGGKKEKEVK
jgi:hypothetical protein